MIPEDSIRTLRGMAAGMVYSAPVSANVLTMVTDDLESHGPISRLLLGHPDAGAPLYYLRALAGVRLLVLTGRAPELADHLRSLTANLNNRVYMGRTRDLFRRTLLGHPDEIRAAMDRPVQQHQPDRAGHLLRGLGMLAAPKVRLIEIGACAGLNLLVDQYRWFGHGWEWGNPASPVRLATTGPRPDDFDIVYRAGCDIAPRDATDSRDVAILRSFIPHEREVEQLELDDALALAARTRVRIDKAEAVEWLRTELSCGAPPGTYTVVWHSLFWGYLSPVDQAAIEEILDKASQRMRLARVCWEPPSWAFRPSLSVTVYS